jgi:hypothetical protein
VERAPASRRQPFVEDDCSSGKNGWNFQPFVEDGRSPGENGWNSQPFVEDGDSSGENGWDRTGRRRGG